MTVCPVQMVTVSPATGIAGAVAVPQTPVVHVAAVFQLPDAEVLYAVAEQNVASNKKAPLSAERRSVRMILELSEEIDPECETGEDAEHDQKLLPVISRSAVDVSHTHTK